MALILILMRIPNMGTGLLINFNAHSVKSCCAETVPIRYVGIISQDKAIERRD